MSKEDDIRRRFCEELVQRPAPTLTGEQEIIMMLEELHQDENLRTTYDMWRSGRSAYEAFKAGIEAADTAALKQYAMRGFLEYLIYYAAAQEP